MWVATAAWCGCRTAADNKFLNYPVACSCWRLQLQTENRADSCESLRSTMIARRDPQEGQRFFPRWLFGGSYSGCVFAICSLATCLSLRMCSSVLATIKKREGQEERSVRHPFTFAPTLGNSVHAKSKALVLHAFRLVGGRPILLPAC